MSTLHIFRGLPGAGKTTEANKIGCFVLSPHDMYSIRDGKYCFNMDDSIRAHRLAIELAITIFDTGVDLAIAGVLPTLDSVYAWDALARHYGYLVKVKDLIISVDESFARNTHGLSRERIQEFADVFQPYKEYSYGSGKGAEW